MRIAIVAAWAFLGGVAQAGTIVQEVSFVHAEHGSSGLPFRQFDPTLGTLQSVTFDVTAAGDGGVFLVENPTASTLGFHVRLFVGVNTDGGSLSSTSTVPVTLGPHDRSSFDPTVAGSRHRVETAFLAPFIGTGTVDPIGMIDASVTPDDPRIAVDRDIFGSQGVRATETITYTYGPAVPEPASLVLFGVGMVVSLATARIRSSARRGS